MSYKAKFLKYLKSDEWATMKIELVVARGAKCERCERKERVRKLRLHHINYDRVFNEEPEDLELLCKGCFNVERGRRARPEDKKNISDLALQKLIAKGKKFRKLE